MKQPDMNVFSLLLHQFLQLKIDHASRTGVQFCFIVALSSQTSPIFFVHSALSSIFFINHSSPHISVLPAGVNTFAVFIMMENTENHYLLLKVYAAHTLTVSGSPTVVLVFIPLLLFLHNFWGECAKSRESEDKKESRRQCREKERTSMSWVRERIDVKDRWKEI